MTYVAQGAAVASVTVTVMVTVMPTEWWWVQNVLLECCLLTCQSGKIYRPSSCSNMQPCILPA